MSRSDGTPLWLAADGGAASPMVRLDPACGVHDEAWLQARLHEHPALFPVERIEPGFGAPLSLCRELPLDLGAGRMGYLDNVMVTPTGGLILVETKLWRNPEARRTVIAQALDYAAAVFALDYAGFETAVRRARVAEGAPPLSIWQIARAADPSTADEPVFIDALARNLARGRAIVSVVGDGIREDLGQLAGLLQSHAGHRFVFALVELGLFAAPGGAVVILPSVLARTTLIERGVVRIENASTARVTVSAAPEPAAVTSGGRGRGLSEDEFFEEVTARDPALAAHLREFLGRCADLGIHADMGGALSLKHPSPVGNPLNLGTIGRNFTVEPGPATWFGRLEQGRVYCETLARLVGGQTKATVNGTELSVRRADGTMPRLSDLLPAHGDAWLDAMAAYVAAFPHPD